MNQDIKQSPFKVIPKLLDWLKRPCLLSASMPNEIFPQGLVSLELELNGWGWVQLKGTDRSEPRNWFYKQGKLTLYIPVGSQPTLTISNFWGGKSYQIDAGSNREEIWVPHGNRFLFRLPDSVSAKIKTSAVIAPTDLWRVAGINASGRGHWHIHMPTGNIVSLPAMPPNLTLKRQKIDDWCTLIPMSELDHRIQQASNTN